MQGGSTSTRRVIRPFRPRSLPSPPSRQPIGLTPNAPIARNASTKVHKLKAHNMLQAEKHTGHPFVSGRLENETIKWNHPWQLGSRNFLVLYIFESNCKCPSLCHPPRALSKKRCFYKHSDAKTSSNKGVHPNLRTAGWRAVLWGGRGSTTSACD
jgi:hypothetical protein